MPALTLDLERSLRAAEPIVPRKADRVHRLNLTGTMERYVWSINGIVWSKDVPPLPVAEGERVELVFDRQAPTRLRCICTAMHFRWSRSTVRLSGARRDKRAGHPPRRVASASEADNRLVGCCTVISCIIRMLVCSSHCATSR